MSNSLEQELDWYRKHSPLTEPGDYRHVWSGVEPTAEAIANTILPLVIHYRGDAPLEQHGIEEARVSEIDLRYVDSMLARLEELAPVDPGTERLPKHRLVGCCRDWTVLAVSLARELGIPARMRVGFANYFMDDWWLDHVVAELWDDAAQRWVQVDTELGADFVPADGVPMDRLNIPTTRFLPGIDAWRKTRAGELDPRKFVVHPEIPDPDLRGVPYLWHNTVLDLASLNKQEMVLWDVWGIDAQPVSEEGAVKLDNVSAATRLSDLRQIYETESFKVPCTVTSYPPYDPVPPREVEMRQ